jgi:hypothetical protein
MTSVVPSRITAAPDVTLTPATRLQDNNRGALCSFLPWHRCRRRHTSARSLTGSSARHDFTAGNPRCRSVRMCDHPCEESCVRGLKMRRSHSRLEAFPDRKGLHTGGAVCPGPDPRGSWWPVGTGPLTAAWMLRQAGYRVTAYEGITGRGMRYAIPAFRFRSVLDYEIGPGPGR